MIYKNRAEAGELLSKELTNYKSNKNAVIVSVPRGGVPIGAVMAEKLNLPLEIVLSKKIGHPFHKEFAIGALTLNSIILGPVAADLPKIYIERETNRIRDILKKRSNLYYGKRKPLDFTNQIVIIVDDGVATGNTLISSIELIKLHNPKEIIIAVPVASEFAFNKIKNSVDKVICLTTPEEFRYVGQFYEQFNQVSDTEVIQLLKKANENHQNTASSIT